MVFPRNGKVALCKFNATIMFVGEITKMHLSYVASVLLYSVLNTYLYSMNGLYYT